MKLFLEAFVYFLNETSVGFKLDSNLAHKGPLKQDQLDCPTDLTNHNLRRYEGFLSLVD